MRSRGRLLNSILALVGFLELSSLSFEGNRKRLGVVQALPAATPHAETLLSRVVSCASLSVDGQTETFSECKS